MSDILIKGMEMPVTCSYCPLIAYDPDIEWNDGGRETQGAIEINNPMIREDKVTFDAYGRKMFAVLWEATVGEAKRVKNGWAANPWVWVIEFERCGRPKEG